MYLNVPFLIAMLNYQRVILHQPWMLPNPWPRKPGNTMLLTPFVLSDALQGKSQPHVLLVDFGLAEIFDEQVRLRSLLYNIYIYIYIYIHTYISSIFGSSHLVYICAGSGSWDPWLNKTTNKTAAFLSPWIVYIYIYVYICDGVWG